MLKTFTFVWKTSRKHVAGFLEKSCGVFYSGVIDGQVIFSRHFFIERMNKIEKRSSAESGFKI